MPFSGRPAVATTTIDPAALSVVPTIWIDAENVTGTDDAIVTAITNRAGGGGGGLDPTHWLGSQRNGVNHVSMNLGHNTAQAAGGWSKSSGPVRNTNYPTYSDGLLDYYQAKGIKCVRFMITWEALQSSLGGTVPPSSGTGYANYWTDFQSVITRLLARDIYVSISPWQYNNASGDTDITYDGASFSSANFGDFWGKLATAVNTFTGNDQRVAFDLINEPHTHAESGGRAGDIGISLANWFTCAQSAIDAIRATGATNTILVPGMAYTSSTSFVSNGSAAAFLALTDSANNLAVTCHNYNQYFNGHLTSSTSHRDGASALVAWAQSNGVKVQIGEIASDVNANGVSTGQAQAAWADWDSFCTTNNDVIVGWTWWGNSASGWWDTGDTHWALTTDNGGTDTKFMDLIEGTLGEFPMAGGGGGGVTVNVIPSLEPIWSTAQFKSSTKHSLNYSGDWNWWTAFALDQGATFWMAVKYTSSDTSATTTGSCPLTLFSYDGAGSTINVGFSAGTPRYSHAIGGTFLAHDGTATNLNDGLMHTVCWTHTTGGTISCWIDGTLTNTFSRAYDTTMLVNNIGIGHGDTDGFQGHLAEAMVFNGVITDQEIRSLHTRASQTWA